MVTSTPHTQAHDGLAALASRFVSVDDLPWVATKYDGIDMKILVEDPDTGLVTRAGPLSSGGPTALPRTCGD